MSAEFAPRRQVLSNGLTVVHQHNPSSPAVVASLSFPAGAVYDPEPQAGLATLAAPALRRGTRSRSKLEIGEVLDFRGAHLSCSASRHTASLVAKMRAVDAGPVLELLAECAREPSFPDAEVDQLRGNRITSLRESLDDPDTMAGRGMRGLLFDDAHPYARPATGTEESVEGIEAGDALRFHADRYRPETALLVVVGALAWDESIALADQLLGPWSSEDASPADTSSVESGYRAAHAEIPDAGLADAARHEYPMPDKSQVSLVMAHAGIRRNDPRFYTAALMNSVLGRFAMGGRLGTRVREDGGMAYYTYSDFAAGLGAGSFSVRAGVQPEHLEAATGAIREEVRRLRCEGVTDGELDDVRAAAIASLPRGLESNEGVAGMLHRIEMFDLGWDFPARYPSILEAITRDDVNDVARELLHPDALCVSVAGPLAATS